MWLFEEPLFFNSRIETKTLQSGCTKLGHLCGRPEGEKQHNMQEADQQCGGGASTILLSNVRSLVNQIDHLQLELSSKRELRNCCVLILMDSWLISSIPDNAVSLEGFANFRADRNSCLGCKSRGGGLCFYINNNWYKISHQPLLSGHRAFDC
ncbi:unnamed protein product [Menidia menidia]|uniref:(Atlantic silverside) hypothetical protein n=1 Tax=Menidia menidia TaxID=238744 RepID=A0A8S4AF58_9TELE|nr:unnamed protein product [Menidia menidia]